MRAKYLAAAIAAVALAAGGARAAETGAMGGATAPSTAQMPSAAQMKSDSDWRATKLAGVGVYNDSNERIGTVNDVILEKNGKVAAVILGVGGFLGVGERYVAVNFDQLKWSNEPIRTSSTTGAPPANSIGAARPATNVDSTSKTAAENNSRVTTGAATSSSTSKPNDDKWYPDHAVFSATMEQLKAMPQFEY